jgi:hypothetical protein
MPLILLAITAKSQNIQAGHFAHPVFICIAHAREFDISPSGELPECTVKEITMAR